MRLQYLSESFFFFLAAITIAEGNADECVAMPHCSRTMGIQKGHLSEYAKAIIVDGVELPGRRLVDGVNLFRNGHGVRFVPFFGMNIKIYVAAMYSAMPILSAEQAMRSVSSGNPETIKIIDADMPRAKNHRDNLHLENGPIQMDFTFLRYVGQSRVVSAWTQQLDHSVTYRDYDGYEDDRNLFIRLASSRPIENMGTQTVQLVGDETRVVDQGIFQGAIPGRNFQRSFLSMWFGSMAVCEDLKSSLLKGDEHHPSAVKDIQTRFEEEEFKKVLIETQVGA